MPRAGRRIRQRERRNHFALTRLPHRLGQVMSRQNEAHLLRNRKLSVGMIEGRTSGEDRLGEARAGGRRRSAEVVVSTHLLDGHLNWSEMGGRTAVRSNAGVPGAGSLDVL